MNEGKRTLPVYMQVTVFDPEKDDEVIQEYTANYSDQEIKAWLMRLFVWAMLNNKVIELSPAKEVNTALLFKPKPAEAMAS